LNQGDNANTYQVLSGDTPFNSRVKAVRKLGTLLEGEIFIVRDFQYLDTSAKQGNYVFLGACRRKNPLPYK